METGRFQINVTPEDADIVYVSESGPPDPTKAAKVSGTGLRNCRARRVVPRRRLERGRDDGRRLRMARADPRAAECHAGFRRTTGLPLPPIPRAAVIRATFDGSDPRQGAEVAPGEIDAPKGAKQVRVIAEVGGAFGQEESAPLGGRP